MLRTEETEIGETRFQVTQMPAGKGRKLLVRLTKVIGPTLAAAVAELPEGESAEILDTPVKALSGALFELCEKLTEQDMDYLCSQLAAYTSYSQDGSSWLKLDSKGDFDLIFAGRYLDMLKWLAFGLQVNYADFFGESGLVEKAREAIAKAKAQPNQSPNTSTGGSTESPQPTSTATA